jgi:hypothetical protein
VVRLDEEKVDVFEGVANQVGSEPEIGGEPHNRCAVRDAKTHRVGGVVARRYRKELEVCRAKRLPGFEKAYFDLVEPSRSEDSGRRLVACFGHVNGNAKATGPDSDPSEMVSVFVGHHESRDPLGVEADRTKAALDSAARKTGVDQHAPPIGPHEDRVSLAAARQGAKLQGKLLCVRVGAACE